VHVAIPHWLSRISISCSSSILTWATCGASIVGYRVHTYIDTLESDHAMSAIFWVTLWNKIKDENAIIK
jgi:hypothetical protein